MHNHYGFDIELIEPLSCPQFLHFRIRGRRADMLQEATGRGAP